MTSVVVSGGPFTDGLGNPLPGDFQFQPIPQTDVTPLSDDEPRESHGTLGGFLAYPFPGGAQDLPDPGTFSVTLAEGTYTFRLRLETQVFTAVVVIDHTAPYVVDNDGVYSATIEDVTNPGDS